MKKKMVGGVSEKSGILGVIKEITRQLCDGELSKEQGQAIIEHRNPFFVKIWKASISCVFPIFKTITLGLCKSSETYREALLKAGFRIGDWANDILNKIQISPIQTQLDLVFMSVADLGFKEATRLDKIYARAKELGLELCPAEVGPALCLAYHDQSYGEYLRIAMEPIDSDGDLSIFWVYHFLSDRWLSSTSDDPGLLWVLDSRFVFVLSCK